jgi:addiction module HigA family antidote
MSTRVNRMRPIHPGEILREEYLIPMGMSANAFALAIDVPANRVSDIVRERRGLTADTASRLARALGTSAEFWLNMQKTYELREFETSQEAKKIHTIRPIGRRPFSAAAARKAKGRPAPRKVLEPA